MYISRVTTKYILAPFILLLLFSNISTITAQKKTSSDNKEIIMGSLDGASEEESHIKEQLDVKHHFLNISKRNLDLTNQNDILQDENFKYKTELNACKADKYIITKELKSLKAAKVKSQKHKLKGKSPYNISSIKKKGTTFVITGESPDDDVFYINFLLPENDIGMHIVTRFQIRHTAFNNYENKTWHEEEKVFWFPFKKGEIYTFAFNIETFGTTVYLDGTLFHHFKHRTDPEKFVSMNTTLADPSLYFVRQETSPTGSTYDEVIGTDACELSTLSDWK